MVQQYFNIRKRNDSGSWEVDFSIEGKRFRKSYRNVNKSQARQLAEKFLKEKLFGVEQESFISSDIQTSLTQYIDWSRNVKHKKERSIQTDKSSINQFLKYAPIQDLKELDESLISQVIGKMKEDGYSLTTINIMIRCWKNICNRAVEWNMIQTNPLSKIKQLKVAEKELIYCTKIQRETFIECAKGYGKNIHLVCALGFYAGLRKREISFARWEWFDLDRNLINLSNYDNFETKSRKNRTIPLLNNLKKILLEYGENQKEGFLFEKANGTKEYHYYFRKMFDRIRRETGLNWVTPHTMRHTFASLLAQEGVPLYSITSWMGHSHSRVTELYAHLQAYDINIEKMM